MIFGESNRTFDCNGHLIDGDDVAIDPDHGIVMLHGSNNTIKNCTVTDFFNGIYIGDATDHTVINNVLLSNGVGLRLAFTAGVTVTGNAMEENYIGIYLDDADSGSLVDNRVCFNLTSDFSISESTGNSGTMNQCNVPGAWNDDGTTGCTYPCWTCWLHLPIIAR